jgi:hypothetical protein
VPAFHAPVDWLQLAKDARAIAVRLTDPEAKQALEDMAAECETLAQDADELIALLSRPEKQK